MVLLVLETGVPVLLLGLSIMAKMIMTMTTARTPIMILLPRDEPLCLVGVGKGREGCGDSMVIPQLMA